jgi:hypothetical protein
MTIQGRVEGAALRQRTTYDFAMAPPAPAKALDLGYVRASGLAQVRLQLAVLSGNRRGALRQVDRLVEIDKQLEALGSPGAQGEMPGAALMAELDEQRQAIATEKLALMAAIEFPRLAAAERAEDAPVPDEAEIVVLEDTEFGHRLVRALAWLAALIVLGTALAFALPTLATL